MDRYHHPARIYQSRLTLAGMPRQPGIPAVAAYQKRRHLSIEEIAGKTKIVHPTRTVLFAFEQGQGSQLPGPIRLAEVPRFGDVRIPTPADHQKRTVGPRHQLEPFKEIARQHDIAVGITEIFMAGHVAGPVEQVVQVLSAVLIPADLGLVPDAEVPARLRSAFLVSKEDYFRVRMEKCPALEGVPLNDIAVANEGLWS